MWLKVSERVIKPNGRQGAGALMSLLAEVRRVFMEIRTTLLAGHMWPRSGRAGEVALRWPPGP